MPSTFPPPSVERHHSRRRSGRHEDADLERGGYSSRPSSGHYNDGVNQPANYAYQPPRSSHENPNTSANYEDPYDQAASRPAGGYQNPGVNTAPQQTQNYNPNHDSINHQNARETATHHHAPHQGTYNNKNNNHQTQRQPRNTGPKKGILPSFFNRHRGKDGGKSGRSGPGGGHTLQHQPSPLEPEARGGKWETIRAHLVAMSGEFIGTILFLWFALSAAQVTAMTNPDPSGAQSPQTLLFIALAFGFSLSVNAWSFYRISGGLFNPAVVLGMVVTGSLPWMRGLFLLPAQILGSIIAAALVQCMFPGDVASTLTIISSEVSVAQGLFIEMFLTALLVFTILMLAAEKHEATFLAPVGIGLSLFVAELSGKSALSLHLPVLPRMDVRILC
jgi:glycerol uptake facilitator-like aquaporin